jgi:hypothetical protein
MRKGALVLLLNIAKENARTEIASNAARGKYGSGLSGEGYAGGYRDALEDVLLLINSGTLPNRRGWWQRRDSTSTRSA